MREFDLRAAKYYTQKDILEALNFLIGLAEIKSPITAPATLENTVVKEINTITSALQDDPQVDFDFEDRLNILTLAPKLAQSFIKGNYVNGVIPLLGLAWSKYQERRDKKKAKKPPPNFNLVGDQGSTASVQGDLPGNSLIFKRNSDWPPWPKTVKITHVTISPSWKELIIRHKAPNWPEQLLPDIHEKDPLAYNLIIGFPTGENEYTFEPVEWGRLGQESYTLNKILFKEGHLSFKYDPESGDLLYFVIAGFCRSPKFHNVQERSELYSFVLP